MYGRIDIPSSYKGWPQATMTEFKEMVDRANAAHLAAKGNAAAHLAADRALQQDLTKIEACICGDDYKSHSEMRAALTSIRDKLRTCLVNAGKSPQAEDEPQTSLSRVIAELPDAIAEKLARILVEHRANQTALNSALCSLFPTSDASPAAKRWRDYLEKSPQHTITYLGGSNIINFKVATLPEGLEPTEVLKLEYRFGYARRMDDVTRKAIPGLLTPTAAARMVMAPKKNMTDSLTGRSLMVTTLCTYGGADNYAEHLRKAVLLGGSATKFAQQAHDIATQMCSALQKFEANNIYFPDAKLSNWVVNAPHTLQIADTKSFLHSPPKTLDLTHLNNCGKTSVVATEGYVSNEVFNHKTTPTQIHSAIFGRNLYNFLTGQNPSDTIPPACTETVFTKPGGAAFKALITGLTRNPPSSRITLNVAAEQLRLIGISLNPVGVTLNDPKLTDPNFRLSEMTSDPKYASIEDKIRTIGLLTKKDHSALLLSRARAMCSSSKYSKDAALSTLDNLVTNALVLAKEAGEIRNALIPSPVFNGKQLITEELIDADQNTYINSVADLDTFISGLTTHVKHLQSAKNALPQMQKLRNLVYDCEDRGFGYKDVELENYLNTAKLEALGGVDLTERIARIDKVSTKLINTRAILHSATVDSVLRSIASLKAMREYQEAAQGRKLESVAANVPLAMRGDLVANANVPEVKALRKELAIAELLLTPAYTKIIAKVKDIEALTHENHRACLEASILAECSVANYDQTVALAHLNDAVDRALASAHDAAKSHKSIVSSTKCILDKRPIISENLLSADQAACIGTSTNMTQLAEGLAIHAKRLKDAEVALPKLNELGGLVNVCRSQRFEGEYDFVMSEYLRDITRRVTKNNNLPETLNQASQVHAELIATTKGLRSPGINEIHLIIQDLRAKDSESHGAKAKARAIENAAKDIPINQRANLIANQKEPKVRALFDILAKNYSTYGLGSIAADPMSVSEYQRVMKAINPEKPEAPEPATQVRPQP